MAAAQGHSLRDTWTLPAQHEQPLLVPQPSHTLWGGPLGGPDGAATPLDRCGAPHGAARHQLLKPWPDPRSTHTGVDLPEGSAQLVPSAGIPVWRHQGFPPRCSPTAVALAQKDHSPPSSAPASRLPCPALPSSPGLAPTATALLTLSLSASPGTHTSHSPGVRMAAGTHLRACFLLLLRSHQGLWGAEAGSS